jgi:hypothetical protein
MGGEFLTWGNFITWVVCSIGIYLSLNFRLYMIFHHPGRKFQSKVKARQRAIEVMEKSKPATEPQGPEWEGNCQPGSCPAG